MVLHLSFHDSHRDILDLSECSEIFLGGGASLLSLTVNLDEIDGHWHSFERTVFIADLLGINGVFILTSKTESALEQTHQKLLKRIMDLYKMSSFAEFDKIIFADTNREDYVYPKKEHKKKSVVLSEVDTNELRTIIVWESQGVLQKEVKLRLHFFHETIEATVLQVQKIISPDYHGSTFGVHEVNYKEIGAVLLKTNKNFERFFYDEKPEKGFFEIIGENKSILLGYGIVIRL